jgi:hypothetical protein
MDLPFTRADFFSVFAIYNQAVWPLQVGFVVLAVGAAAYAARGGRHAARLAHGVLGLLWVWMGVVYHWTFFRAINPAAAGFAALFVTQGVLLLGLAGRKESEETGFTRDRAGYTGLAIIGYALVLYPLIGLVAGHHYPHSPTFGLPCPTTLFTFGLLLWVRPLGYGRLIIPVLWALIATMAALRLGVYQDLALPLAAALAIVVRRRGTTAGRRREAVAEPAAR